MTINKIKICILSVFTVSQPLFGAGFDCTKAGTVVEKTICSDQTLSDLDDFLSFSYKKALENSLHKNTTRAAQRDWLRSRRNKCNDDEQCIKEEYLSRIMELTDSDKGTSISGDYERYYQGKPDFNPSDINILKLKDKKIYIHGIAIWFVDKQKSILHLGEIEGSSLLIGDKAHYQDEYGGSLIITFGKSTLLISESTDPAGEWGVNVTFDGQYRKIKQKPDF